MILRPVSVVLLHFIIFKTELFWSQEMAKYLLQDVFSKINIPFFRNNSEIFSPKYFLSENTSAYQNVQAYFNLIKANGN